jgi:large subunit ribosomal protein L25
MKSVPLTVYPRNAVRRSAVKQLRQQARVPAVIYGRKRQPQNLEIILKELEDLIHGSVAENILLDLKVQGDTEPDRLALLQSVQHHPLSGQILHADFHEVAHDERVVITVPVEAIGEASGVKNSGGVLEHVLFKVKVRGLPKDLPELLEVDVTHLEIGQAVHIGDLKPPAGVDVIGDKHISVIAVSAPVTEAEEAAATAEAEAGALEPEVIKEKKEEGEGEGEKAPAKPGAKPGEKAGEKPAADKSAEKAPAKGAEKAAAKAPEKKK